MEVLINFLKCPYIVGGLIVCVIFIYIIKGDMEFMPRPKKKD